MIWNVHIEQVLSFLMKCITVVTCVNVSIVTTVMPFAVSQSKDRYNSTTAWYSSNRVYQPTQVIKSL